MSTKTPLSNTPWPSLQYLIDNGGNLSIRQIRPIRCAAVAADDDSMYAALVRRDGESITDLLDRLDDALNKAFDQEIYTDEING